MRTRKRRFAFVIAGFAAFSVWLSAAAVNYKALATTRLPYGEAITITGDFKDFAADDPKLGKTVIADWAAIKKISVSTSVEGLSPRTAADVTITGTSWTVSVGQLPKNASVKFDFTITAGLNPDKVDQIVDGLVKDDKFNKSQDDFFAAAAGKSAPATTVLKTSLISAIAPIVKAQLPGFLGLSDVKSIVDLLTATDSAFAWVNARRDLKALIADLPAGVTSLAGVTARSTPSEAFATLSGAGRAKLADSEADVPVAGIQAFLEDYLDAVASFKELIANIPVSLQLTNVSTVQDFAKYAGVDIGVLYAPPANSLRTFFTVNIYFGAVEDTPASATPCQSPPGHACTFNDSMFWQIFQQRFSLSGGVSIGDFSGQKNPPFANNYAYVAGGGWRVNKYFRAFLGDLLYRNQYTDRIDHTLSFGFSVDFSAVGNTTSIFGKVQ